MNYLFQSTRLGIRKLRLDDLEAFHDMQGDPDVMRYVEGEKSLEANKKDIEEVIAFYYQDNNTFWVWAVEETKSQEFIGTVALIVNDAGNHEIGYRLRKKFWGKGYGKEVTAALIHYAFEEMNIEVLYAEVDRENIASAKILDSLMTFEKEYFNEKEGCFDRTYWLKREDWENSL